MVTSPSGFADRKLKPTDSSKRVRATAVLPWTLALATRLRAPRRPGLAGPCTWGTPAAPGLPRGEGGGRRTRPGLRAAPVSPAVS